MQFLPPRDLKTWLLRVSQVVEGLTSSKMAENRTVEDRLADIFDFSLSAIGEELLKSFGYTL